MTASVKGFGCRPHDWWRGIFGRSASESLQGRKPRMEGRTCAAGSMGIWELRAIWQIEFEPMQRAVRRWRGRWM